VIARLRRDAAALAGLSIVVAAIAVATLVPALAPGDPIKNSLLDRLTPPNAEHVLGTDTLGRDVASRLLYGARVSLIVGLSAVLLAGTLGIALGLLSGWYRGWVDDLVMRVGDVQLAFPVLVLAVAVLAVLGSSLANLIIVLGLTSWITYARIVRGEVLTLRERDFVAAARALGARDAWILRTFFRTSCRRSRWWPRSRWRAPSSRKRR
jgi:peptide/nickel transport system permease protein